MKNDPVKLIRLIAQTIYDKKAGNILAVDVRDISTITDYVLIAEGNVERHVIALVKTILETLKELGERPAYVEGLDHGDWVVIDYFQIIIYLFIPSLREKYRLEQLWAKGKIIDLDLELDPEKKSPEDAKSSRIT